MTSFAPTALSGVPRDASLVLTFSEPMNRASVEGALTLTVNGAARATTNTWSASGDRLTVRPTTGFVYGDIVSWSLRNAARDLASNALSSPGSRAFTIIRRASVGVVPSAATGYIRTACLLGCSTSVVPNLVVVGDNNSNRPMRSFLSYDLTAAVPSTATAITASVLMLRRRAAYGSPFGPTNLGTMALERVSYGLTLETGDFDTPPLTCDGAVCSTDVFGYPDPQGDIGVLKFVRADWAQRASLGGRSQFRMRFANATDGDDRDDYLHDYRPTLTVTYEYP